MTQRIDIEFPSVTKDWLCRGWFYESQVPSAPVIVMAHGLGGVKEMRLDAYAERFSKAGYHCLVFDYRHFGASDGHPRQILEVALQLEDWASAIAYARQIRPSSPVVLWGSSFAGGHVIAAAAKDGDILAVVSQCPFTDGPASVTALDVWTSLRVTGLALLDLMGSALGRPPLLIKLSGAPGSLALMNAPGTQAEAEKMTESAGLPRPSQEVSARIGLKIGFYRPGRKMRSLKCPILLCLCTKDNIAPPASARRFAEKVSRAEIKEYPASHFAIYMDEQFERVIVDQIDFIMRHEAVARTEKAVPRADSLPH